MNWKELKERKQRELPAAELKRIQKEEKHKKYLNKIVDRVEKKLYSLCQKQEAGTTVFYEIQSVMSFTEEFINVLRWEWPKWLEDTISKEFVEKAIAERLSSEGIEVELGSDRYGWNITLP